MDNNHKIIYYYQSFSSLHDLINLKLDNVYIYVASLHFGIDKEGERYISLNDSSPDSQIDLWTDIEIANEAGLNIMVMLGGAGGAYTSFFQDFNYYYNLLFNFLKRYNFISGIDLDVEENSDLGNIRLLINKLRYDFGDKFIVTMAPIESAMVTDSPGIGGFSYKDLYKSREGQMINWFNVQAYNIFSEDIYTQIINNGYPPEKIVFGMLGDNYNPTTFLDAVTEIKKIYDKFPRMNGVCLWEYGDTAIDPLIWGTTISKIFNIIYP